MERKLDELKISVISMIENLSPHVAYVDAVKNNSSSRMSEQPSIEHNESTSVSGFVHEASVRNSTSGTQLKKVFVPDSGENVQRTSTMTTSTHFNRGSDL